MVQSTGRRFAAAEHAIHCGPFNPENHHPTPIQSKRRAIVRYDEFETDAEDTKQYHISAKKTNTTPYVRTSVRGHVAPLSSAPLVILCRSVSFCVVLSPKYVCARGRMKIKISLRRGHTNCQPSGGFGYNYAHTCPPRGVVFVFSTHRTLPHLFCDKLGELGLPLCVQRMHPTESLPPHLVRKRCVCGHVKI